MKIILRTALQACVLGGLTASPVQAQFTFNCGSDGSYGAMNITSNTTLALPPDGKFHCTTITVASNQTLRFTPNALNTPVYLLATGDVTVEGTIDVSGAASTGILGGAGGPGGFAGGRPPYLGMPPSDGCGPGAGKSGSLGGSGAYGSYCGDAGHGAVYGSVLLLPIAGGSGGGASSSRGGGGGGGAILISSNSRINLVGKVLSNGGGGGKPSQYCSGSGGAIRLLAPIMSGKGIVDVKGGNVYLFADEYAGSGRIRIDAMDKHLMDFSYAPYSAVSLGANMIPFLDPTPRLDITQVAGTNITVGAGSPIFFYLPQGSSTNQTVTVQARDFGAVVPIRVVLTPDSGSNSVYNAQIDNTTVNPASVTVPVVVPTVNAQVQVNAWTR